MKKVRSLLLAVVFLAITLSHTGCYGSFKLTNKLHSWNGQVGDKFVNALVFFAFVVVPVYEVAILADGIVLNTIEFWSGENPVVMNDGDKDVQIVKNEGTKYRITATKNKFYIEQLQGANKGNYAEFVFDPAVKTWSLKDGDKELQKLVTLDEQAQVIEVYKPNGEAFAFLPGTNDLALLVK